MKRSHQIDMTQGALLPKIVMFSLPLLLTGVLQLMFNAADVMVVGKFAGSDCLAAVGSTGSLISLLVNVFVGISTGANVLCARFYGSRDHDALHKCVHCSIALSIVMGILVGIWGAVMSRVLLQLMNVDPTVLPLSSLYLRIYFVGVPATVVYNFGAAILRASGDTEHPLQFLIISGVINVLLNIFLVVVCDMSVDGVAIATAVSQYVSAFLVIRCLMKTTAPHKLELKKVRFYRTYLIQIFRIGIPAGLQSTIFSISNVTIQSAVNSLGPVTMASTSAASNLNSFIYISMNSLYHAALSFTSQNMGAKKKERVKSVIGWCMLLVSIVGIVVGSLVYYFGPQLLSLYISADDVNREAVIATGMIVLGYWSRPYFIFGIMEVGAGIMRGLGKSWTPLLVSGIGICVLRVLWVHTIFAANPTLETLYLSYPVSWVVSTTAMCLFLIPILWKLYRKEKAAA